MNTSACSNSAAVIQVMNGTEKVRRLLRVAVIFCCDFIKGITIAIILFPGLPGDADSLIQDGEILQYLRFFIFRKIREHDPKLRRR